jgi:hypothetical protein
LWKGKGKNGEREMTQSVRGRHRLRSQELRMVRRRKVREERKDWRKVRMAMKRSLRRRRRRL